MCTAIVFGDNNRYFGRNLDYEVSFGERVVITPRRIELPFRYMPSMKSHAAFIGMAAVVDGYPLYYDATNEYGLSIAGLNFVGNCHFSNIALDMHDNLCVFELIPYVLGKCRSVSEAKTVFDRINLLGEPFSSKLPAAQLHWLISDREECCVFEITRCGVNVFCNSMGVLTNNPPFSFHLENLNLYRSLSPDCAEVRFGYDVPYYPFSRGMGALGLPGDLSSQSRFVKAAFTASNSICNDSEEDSVTQFMHILKSAEQQKGCVRIGEGYEITQYSSCINADRGRMYFTTYGNSRISVVDMNKEDLDSDDPISFPMDDRQDFDELNACVKCGHGRRSPSCRP